MDAGIVPFAKSAGTIGLPHFSWLDRFFMRTMSDDTYRISLKIGEGSWDTPEFRKVDSYWDDLLPYWHPDCVSLTYGDIYMMFARGDIAMQTIGSWIIGSYESEMGMVPFEDYDMFLFPIIDPDIPLRETGNSNSIQLSMPGKDNKAAQAWVAYWARPETQQLYCNYTSNMPAIEGVAIDSPMPAKIAEAVKGRMLYYQWQQGPSLHELVVNEIEKRSYRITTIDECIEDLEKIYTEWREKQK